MALGTNAFGTGASYDPLDLFHYSAPGVRDFKGYSGYASADVGKTNLDNFNTIPGGDLADWASSAGNDVSAHAHDLLGGTVAATATNGMLAGDSDANPSDVLSVSAVLGSGTNVGNSVNGAFGLLTLNSDGSYSYPTPIKAPSRPLAASPWIF